MTNSASRRGRPRLSRPEADARQRRIVAAHRRGVSVRTIADEEGVTRQAVYKVLAAWKDVPSVPPPEIRIEAVEEVRTAIAAFDQAIEDLAVIASSDGPSSVRLGAVTRMLDARERRLQLLASVGMLPRNLAAPQIEQEMRAVLALTAEVLRRNDVAQSVVEELLEATEQRMRGVTIEAQVAA